MLWQLHILKDLSDFTQSLVTELLNRIIQKAKTNRNKRDNSNIVSNKVKKVNLAEPCHHAQCHRMVKHLVCVMARRKKQIDNGKG